MASNPVTLRFAPGRPRLRLRDLTGVDEHAVAGTSTEDAIRLLDTLLLAPAGEAAPPPVADLVASDRDRLLLVVYQRAFGDRIENTIACSRCSHPFDIDFSLGDLAASLEKNTVAAGVRSLGENRFETSEGRRFRLPTGRDECALAALPADEAERGLLRCCLVEDEPAPAKAAALQELLTEVAPLIDLELDAHCPECRCAHAFQFDLQSYLLGALLGERPRLIQEIHRIARAYGWSLREILSLARTERRHFIELIDNDSAARSRRHFS